MILALALLTLAAAPDAGPAHPEHPDHAEHHHGSFGAHGNPTDMAGYIAEMESPERAAWQKPDEVVAALDLKPGQTACDLGSGPGYFTLRMAKVVGEQGRVFAVDVEPQMLSALAERLQKGGVRNVTPVLALPDDALLPRGACDVILIVDTYHHLEGGVAYLKQLTHALAKGGRIVNIDFQKRELPVGPPLAHKIAREDFLREAQQAGLRIVGEKNFLPYQYFVILGVR